MTFFHPNRRELLQMSAGSLLTAGLWPGVLAAEGKSSDKDYSFIVVNDTHYVDRNDDDWMSKVLKQMKGHMPKVDFCLHVGDVSDNGTQIQLGAMRDHFKDAGLTMYVVIGNHDYLTDPTNRKRYEEFFPERINYHFEHQGWQFLGLDSTEGVKYKSTSILPETLKWLDEHLPK